MKLPSYINLIIYNIIIVSTIIAISSTSLLIIWLSIELNIFSFLPILINNITTNETEGSINYFLAQALGSTIILARRTILFSSPWFKTIIISTLVIALLLKIGAAPCHYWYPVTIEIIRWINCLLLSSWQKIAPVFILLYAILPKIKSTLIIIIISINALTGGIIGLRQSSIKKIIAYSSITHIRWILRRSIINTPYLSVIYFSLYFLIILPLFLLFNKTIKNKINDLWSKQIHSIPWIITISTILLSLGGLPPLTGFIPKLLIINILLNYSIIATIALIFGSLLNLFFYLNISLSILIKNQENFNIAYKSITIPNLINILLTTNLFIIIIITI